MSPIRSEPRQVDAQTIGRESDLTLVELTWKEGQIEQWIRFGYPVWEERVDHHRRRFGFVPGAIFGVNRWAANAYGTVLSRFDILQAAKPGTPMQTLSFLRPGGTLLLSTHGWPKVERVLQAIDAIEALGIDPADASPDYWRHLHNRLATAQPAHPYTRLQHRAWLKRRSLGL
ncbi:MAG: glycosidase [Nioella sp.]|nr:glycosidase [Nioella sp.]